MIQLVTTLARVRCVPDGPCLVMAFGHADGACPVKTIGVDAPWLDAMMLARVYQAIVAASGRNGGWDLVGVPVKAVLTDKGVLTGLLFTDTGRAVRLRDLLRRPTEAGGGG